MSRRATILGCVLALTVGIQVAEASSCVDHQLVDKFGQVVRDANGNSVSCGVNPNGGDPEWSAVDPGPYLGAGALLIGGGLAAALATSSSDYNSGVGPMLVTSPSNNNRGGDDWLQQSWLQNEWIYRRHPASP